MIGATLKRSFYFSLLGHCALFALIGLSFGEKLPPLNNQGIVFWGSFLENRDFSARPTITNIMRPADVFVDRLNIPLTKGAGKVEVLPVDTYRKPAIELGLVQKRDLFDFLPPLAYSRRRPAEPVIVLHPNLPYDFLIFFKDRQMVHMELAFNISSEGKESFILLKRKISSGNLEADLLGMRYINHYLFVQQSRFSPNKWQTLKIDLSAKND